jgi:hypothetical protein
VTAERLDRIIALDDQAFELNGGLVGTSCRVDVQTSPPELYLVAIGDVGPADLPRLLDAALAATGRTPRSRPWRPGPACDLTWDQYNR